ncbi:MAG: sigma-70 family RNA polymerase sigma factor [Armatimonadota bacterium]|nr:sigma-70 family RNA polymerase sigma factor [Armatimonadota bacterium]
MQEWRLLREYVEDGSQTAFASLVDYHLNFVYSTCLREVGDPTLAEDVTQVVFLLLSRKAGTLREGTVLAGWLFNTARFASKNALRQEARRKRREQKAAEELMRELQPRDATWKDLEPLLHDALAALSAQERNIVLLRFFEGQSLRQAGESLGISEDAARMRATRSLEKLRHYFSRHGYAVPVMVLAGWLSTQVVSAAPASCAGATTLLLSSGAASTATAGPIAVCSGTKVLMLATEIKKAVLISQIKFAVSVAAGTTVVAISAGGMAHLATAPAHTDSQAERQPVVQAVLVPRRGSQDARATAVPVTVEHPGAGAAVPRRRSAAQPALLPATSVGREQWRPLVTSRARSGTRYVRALTREPKRTIRVNNKHKRNKVVNVRKSVVLPVKQAVVPVALAAMIPVSGAVAPVQAAPPPWAPAHGYRAKQAQDRQKPAKDQGVKDQRAPEQGAREQIRGKEAERTPAEEARDAQAGPPPWAPTHGYRAKQAQREAAAVANPGAGANQEDRQRDQQRAGAGEERGGPPPWAPAWGRRGQHPLGKQKARQPAGQHED